MKQFVPLSIDRAVTVLWLAYPVLLFSLPPDLRIGPVAPETAVLFVYGSILGLSVLVARSPVGAETAAAALPLGVWAFALLSFAFVALKGEPTDVLRGISWGMLLFLTAVVFRHMISRDHLWEIWLLIAVVESLIALWMHGVRFPEEVDVLTWTHRTVLGYFVAFGFIIAVVKFLQSSGRSIVWYAFGAIICGLVTLLSMARGAWLVAALGMLLIARGRPRFMLAAMSLMLLAVAAVVSGGSLLGDVSARFETLYNWEVSSSNLYRLNLYLAAAFSLPDIWAFGAPTLEFGPFLADYSPVNYAFFSDPSFATDSDVIYFLLLGGLPLFVLVTIVGIRLGFRIWLATDGQTSDLLILKALCGLLMFQFLLDNLFSSALGWFYLGIVCSYVVERADHRAGQRL